MSKFVKVPSLADDLGVSPASIYRLISCGRIRAIRLGGAIRIPEAEAERVMREGTDPAPADQAGAR